MPLTIIPMAINFLTGFMLWQSDVSLMAKIIITVLIVLKFAAFFYSALMAEPGVIRYIGLSACAAVNIGLIIYGIANSIWTVVIGLATTLILLIIWTLPAVFSFGKKDGNEQ